MEDIVINLKEFCLTLPKAVEEYPFGPVPIVKKVHNKMFALINNEGEISLKCEHIIAVEYCKDRYGCK